MTISVKIVLGSTNPAGIRITTFLLRYPRFIHSEFMTHRVFSRNAASSRAIPVAKIIKEIQDDPAMPIFWGAAQKGMQAAEELDYQGIMDCKSRWLQARDSAITHAEVLIALGLHKQIANRILEPWMHMTTLATATDLGNFFNLRVHKDAQPEFQELARQMLVAYEAYDPQRLSYGEWHIPYGDQELGDYKDTISALKICTARAARNSYRNFDGVIDIDADFKMHDRLATSGHWSPFEHAAQAQAEQERDSNFHPTWKQYRKLFKNENQQKFSSHELIEGIEKK